MPVNTDLEAYRFTTLLIDLDDALKRDSLGEADAIIRNIQLIKPKKKSAPAWTPYVEAIPWDWASDAVAHLILNKGIRLEALERALHADRVVFKPEADLKFDMLKLLDGQVPVEVKKVGFTLTIRF